MDKAEKEMRLSMTKSSLFNKFIIRHHLDFSAFWIGKIEIIEVYTPECRELQLFKVTLVSRRSEERDLSIQG